MTSLDAICMRLTGQTLEVVQHQLMAIRANVWSWLLVTLKIRKPRLQLADCDSKARCIVVLSPGGPERLEFWPLDDGLATVGYNVAEAIAPRDPRSRSLTRFPMAELVIGISSGSELKRMAEYGTPCALYTHWASTARYALLALSEC